MRAQIGSSRCCKHRDGVMSPDCLQCWPERAREVPIIDKKRRTWMPRQSGAACADQSESSRANFGYGARLAMAQYLGNKHRRRGALRTVDKDQSILGIECDHPLRPMLS